MTVTRLVDIDPGGAAEVAVAGSLRVETPGVERELNLRYAALRTDVGFVVEETSSESSNKSRVFKLAESQVRCGEGLVLETEDGVVALEPGALALDAPGGRSTPCAEAPAGFDAVWTSPHAKEGRLSRRDTILLPGDRVELVGRVVRGGGGYRGDTAFRMDGPCTLRDLSLGQATLAEQRDRARRLRVGLMIGGLVALAFGIVTAVWPF